MVFLKDAYFVAFKKAWKNKLLEIQNHSSILKNDDVPLGCHSRRSNE